MKVKIPLSFMIATKLIKGIGDKKTQNICNKQKENCNDNLENFIKFIQGAIKNNIKTSTILSQEIESVYCEAKKIINTCKHHNIGIVTYQDPDYPQKLLKYKNYPSYLFYRGDITILNKMKSIALIGTRHPSVEGKKIGIKIGNFLANKNINIVSGLAIGCDAIGHKCAVDTHINKKIGTTTAILPGGLDDKSIYPPQNLELAHKIISEGGLLLSEYIPGTKGNRYTLVARDRYQALLSSGIIPIQTGIHGGTMHAVETALKNKIPVYTPELDSYFKNKEDNEFANGFKNLIDNGAIKITNDLNEVESI